MKPEKIILTLLMLVLISACQSAAVHNTAATNVQNTITAASVTEFSQTETFPPSTTPSKTPTALPTFTVTPSSTEAPTPTPTPHLNSDNLVRLDIEGASLQSAGPWLVFANDLGTIIVDQSGDEVGLIPDTSEDVDPLRFSYNRYYPTLVTAPQGGLYAMFDDQSLVLEIRKLPSNEVLLQLKLDEAIDPEQIEAKNSDYLDSTLGDLYVPLGRMAWSHNGKYLGFVGAVVSPSPDLYTFNVESGLVTQITSTAYPAVDFYWSPTDEYLFHADVETLYIGASGAGYINWEFFASSPDGTKTQSLFKRPEGRFIFNFDGWYNAKRAFFSWEYWWCGASVDLQIVDIGNGNVTPIGPDLFLNFAYDPDHQTMLYAVPDYDAPPQDDCYTAHDPGYFLYSFSDQQTERLYIPGIEVGDFPSIEFNENLSKFIVSNYEEWAVVDWEGNSEIFPEKPIFSPDGKWVILYDTIVNRETGEEIEIQSIDKYQSYYWSPDSSALFYIIKVTSGRNAKYNLLRATAPDFFPEVVIENMTGSITSPRWVIP